MGSGGQTPGWFLYNLMEFSVSTSMDDLKVTWSAYKEAIESMM